MGDRNIVVVAAALVLLALIACRVAAAPSETINVITEFNEESAQRLISEINDVYWQRATAYRKFSDDTLSPQILMRENLGHFYGIMQKFDWRNFKDPLLKRQFEVILRGAKYPKVDYKFKRATHTLKSMSRDRYVCARDNRQKCNMAFIHEIKTVLANSENPDEMIYYWREWRNKMPIAVKDALHYYVQYYRNISEPDGFSATEIWYEAYDDEILSIELEQEMLRLQPFYREVHAHMSHALQVKYGVGVIPPSGLIPHHLFEQLTYQVWKKDAVLMDPFPESRLPNLQAEINGLKPFDLVNMSVAFFEALGFQNLSEDFMSQHFIAMEARTGGPDCKSRIFDYGEIELNYCPKVYYKKLLQTHGDMAHIYYALLKNNMSVGLNQEASPGFGNAMAEAIILSVSNPKHLQSNLGLLKEFDYDDLMKLNRLYRLAVHTLPSILTYYVHEVLWTDMLSGSIESKDYNCRYWNLMQKYLGVEAPVQTDNSVYDMPYKFYEGIVDQYRGTKKIFGEILGYQIYRAICLKTNEYERRNAYKTLADCDFGCNKDAGAILKEMMSAGSTKPWRDIIQPLSYKKSKLSSTAILEYFEPLHNWISDDNIAKNLHVGWENSDKCQGTSENSNDVSETAESANIKKHH